MILTAFMSLAQLEMGSNDTEIDQVDQALFLVLTDLQAVPVGLCRAMEWWL